MELHPDFPHMFSWLKASLSTGIILLLSVLYRVSIKSLPHYKHLLQENYVEYKQFFFKM
jgi:hypothetical protein